MATMDPSIALGAALVTKIISMEDVISGVALEAALMSKVSSLVKYYYSSDVLLRARLLLRYDEQGFVSNKLELHFKGRKKVVMFANGRDVEDTSKGAKKYERTMKAPYRKRNARRYVACRTDEQLRLGSAARRWRNPTPWAPKWVNRRQKSF